MDKPRLLFLRYAIQLQHFTSMRGQRWLGFVKGQKLTSSRWQISRLDPFKAHTCYKGKERHLCNLVIQGPSTSSCKSTGKPLCLGFVRSECFKEGAAMEAGNPPCAVSSPRGPHEKAAVGQKGKGAKPCNREGQKLSADLLLGLGLYFHAT